MFLDARSFVATALFSVTSLIPTTNALGQSFAFGPRPSLSPYALRVPITPQAASFSCGAAVVLSLLVYWNGYDGQEVDLYRALGTNKNTGTEPYRIAQVLRSAGLSVASREGMTIADLQRALTRHQTVILDIQAWPDKPVRVPWPEVWNEGHYVVLVGLDETFAYFMDPSVKTGYAFIPISELLERWHDYEDPSKRQFFGLGIIVEGRSHLSAFPGPLVRIK